MPESFADLFEKSSSAQALMPGAVLKAKVVEIGSNYVKVNAGLKSEGLIPLKEFFDEKNILEITLGDEVDVVLENLENGDGETLLSREKAKKAATWRELEKAYEQGEIVRGIVCDGVKGGFTVEIGKVRAFLPGSLVDVRPTKDLDRLKGKELEFKVIKMDRKRNNIVVSRRDVIQQENSAERSKLLADLHEGQVVVGIVKNLTDYGAFIELGGGVDGLLHITDLAWRRVKHPSEVLTVGDEIRVKVLRYDQERNRVSLGMKQLGDDPWLDITRRYPVGTRLFGRVTNITDYGCFVEIEDGVEGLVHMSEMDWTNKNIQPSKVVSLGEETEVMVLEIDEERRRISLGMKHCKANPWEIYAGTHKKGEKIVGKIRSITDFGIFIGLDGNIDGLVHLSDISWNEPGESAVRNYKKGQEVEAVILAIDPERERISLGIKQLEDDSFSAYVQANGKGSIVKGIVKELEAKQATIELAPEVTAKLRANEISVKDKIDDIRNVLKADEEIEVKIISVDKKNRTINVSIKAKELAEEAEALEKYSSSADEGSGMTTIGELIKKKMAGSVDEDNRSKDDE